MKKAGTTQMDGLALGPVDWPTRMIGVGLVLALAAIQIWDPPLVEAARLRVFDQLQRWAPRDTPTASPVAIVDIDDASLGEICLLYTSPSPRDS